MADPFMLMAMIMAFQVQHKKSIASPNKVFDSDSEIVGIDNGASACMSNVKSNFKKDTLVACNRVAKGFGDRKSVV